MNPSDREWYAGDLKFEPLARRRFGTAQFDLSLWLQEAKGEISGDFEFRTGSVRAGDGRALWVQYLQQVLEGMVADQQRPIGHLELLNESQRRQVLRQFNATEREYDRSRCIHEFFEEQAKRAPDVVAVVYEGQSLSYSQLNARANRVAWFLRARGVGPDQRVGLCMERGPELVIGLLGILKAGGAFVPLDPGNPDFRLQYLITDAAPVVILSQETLRGLPGLTESLCLDSQWAECHS